MLLDVESLAKESWKSCGRGYWLVNEAVLLRWKMRLEADVEHASEAALGVVAEQV